MYFSSLRLRHSFQMNFSLKGRLRAASARVCMTFSAERYLKTEPAESAGADCEHRLQRRTESGTVPSIKRAVGPRLTCMKSQNPSMNA